MNNSDFLEIIIKEIDEISFEELISDNVLNLLKYYIRKYYLADNILAERLNREISVIFQKIIKKIIINFGDFPKIVKYSLNNFYNINEEFNSKELCKNIKKYFYYCNGTELSKRLSNLKSKMIKTVEKGTGKYCLIKKE